LQQKNGFWLSVLDKTLMILLCGFFLYAPAITGGISVEKFLVTQVASTLAAIAVSIFILRRKGFHFSKSRSLFPVKKILLSAFPYAAIVLLMSVHYRLDGFLLRQIKDAQEAGIYAGAYRLLDAANMVGFLTASFLLPFIVRQRENKNEINQVILASRHLLIIFSLATAVVFFFWAPRIQQVLYHNTDVTAINVLQWCLPALIGYSLVQVYGTVLTATGHIVPFCYITLVAVLLNAGLNIWLIPVWGAKGSCIAALASQGFCGIATLVYAQKKCAVPIHFRPVLMYIFIGAALFGFLYWSGQQGLNEIMQIAGALLITIGITLASGLFPAARWKRLFSRPD
jgi:O-antigen/teichoic acid export membrane protein